jgi:cytochrome P450
MTLPPAPRGPHLLQTAGWITRPGPYSRRLRARFGDTFTLHVDRRAPWVVVSHPDDVKQVFTGDPNVFHAGEGNAILKPLLGARSVLLLDGQEHMRERKTLLAFARLRAPLDALLAKEIANRRAAPDVHEREDILSMLVSATDMDDATLRDELVTLLMAGHETTATALAWALERLSRHPQAWERLRTGDEDYLDAVVKETLRLRPIVPAVLRLLKAPIHLAGYDLPQGVAVQPNILLMHTREDVYPDPFAFKPERFETTPAGTYTWIPFGGGVRRCLGATFALFEMKAALRAVAEAVEELRPEHAPDERPARRAVTLVPAKDARVTVARRAAPARREPPVPTGR